MTTEEAIEYALAANAYVNLLLTNGSNTKASSEKAGWNPCLIKPLREEIRANFAARAASFSSESAMLLGLTQITHDAVLSYHFGHCGEQAATAYTFLKQLNVTPIDICQLDGGEHELVALGIVSDADPADITTWGDSVVLCDPWAQLAYPLADFPSQQLPANDVKIASIYGANSQHYLTGVLTFSIRANVTAMETSRLLAVSANKEKPISLQSSQQGFSLNLKAGFLNKKMSVVPAASISPPAVALDAISTVVTPVKKKAAASGFGFKRGFLNGK